MNKKSTDCNNVNVTHKEVIKVLEPFTNICNKSFLTGTFPDNIKIEKALKKKHTVLNYRPVSLLPQFSKILEKLFADRFNAFVEKISY